MQSIRKHAIKTSCMAQRITLCFLNKNNQIMCNLRLHSEYSNAYIVDAIMNYLSNAIKKNTKHYLIHITIL